MRNLDRVLTLRAVLLALSLPAMAAGQAIRGDLKSFGYAYGPDAQFDRLPGDCVAVSSFDAVKWNNLLP